jgi:TonB family protein
MNRLQIFRHAFAALPLFTALVAPLAAQNLLYVEHGGKMCLVRSARGARPYVEVDGKLVAASGNRVVLQKVEEYLPVFIAVRDVEVRTTYMGMVGTAQELNKEFHFRAKFETPYQLDNVFIVLDLDTETAGKQLFLCEVVGLEPNEPKLVSVGVPLSYALGSGHFQLHIFSGGVEVLHSGIPFSVQEAVLDRMVAKRIESVHDAALKPFIGPAPEYPASLLKAKVEGQAVVSFRVGTSGRILAPVVKSASDPAFGEAALAAVRLWRFLPKVKNGHAVETKAEMPFVFAPPHPATDKP